MIKYKKELCSIFNKKIDIKQHFSPIWVQSKIKITAPKDENGTNELSKYFAYKLLSYFIVIELLHQMI
jgi:hypothetical protein